MRLAMGLEQVFPVAGRLRILLARNCARAFPAFLALLAAPASALAAPSTFGPVIGSAILCRSQLDNAYFHDYLVSAFGPSYKHEGGAYWFKADATLWGANVTDIMISDDTSELVFVAAVADTTPDKLEESIRSAVGVRHLSMDNSRYPVRASNPGSKIVYFKTKSKIYCAKYKPLPVGRQR
ncbi:hypothetical protein [Massilia antarctica]|uniref:hypothetical protein n=1 Tax=Massilia antarctica TaxID=2765360 RepID=UPI0006BC661A|nr:hypothetical protein [Massilia sp. H27-R4]MCY0914876.1 hypothetical protein [Massilia sp. H27-R4]CUI08077.1 hypothetical protein BN2497_10931 [Janthinobacterium sp. CG23_2]CUU31863.1 hypothetical protein BN3177_10931 [Janthinobacterium sp. CG23_2]